MSRKNKTLRAFLHQNQNPTIEQAWNAAWKHAQKKFHARSMQDMEKQVAALQAENERLREALRGMVGIIDDSSGVVGYHLNGALTTWGWFDAPGVAESALAAFDQGRGSK